MTIDNLEDLLDLYNRVESGDKEIVKIPYFLDDFIECGWAINSAGTIVSYKACRDKSFIYPLEVYNYFSKDAVISHLKTINRYSTGLKWETSYKADGSSISNNNIKLKYCFKLKKSHLEKI